MSYPQKCWSCRTCYILSRLSKWVKLYYLYEGKFYPLFGIIQTAWEFLSHGSNVIISCLLYVVHEKRIRKRFLTQTTCIPILEVSSCLWCTRSSITAFIVAIQHRVLCSHYLSSVAVGFHCIDKFVLFIPHVYVWIFTQLRRLYAVLYCGMDLCDESRRTWKELAVASFWGTVVEFYGDVINFN
jgi:hypothetical protein